MTSDEIRGKIQYYEQLIADILKKRFRGKKNLKNLTC